MKGKIVYEDGGYTKVARGNYTEDETFVTVNNIRINKRFIVSIKNLE